MENDNQPSPAIEQTAKPKVGVTFRVDSSDLDKFKRICAYRGISQAKQFVQWIRGATDSVEINTNNDSSI